MEGIQVVTQDFVNVLITKSDNEDAPPVERRFKKAITISEFKVSMIHIMKRYSENTFQVTIAVHSYSSFYC